MDSNYIRDKFKPEEESVTMQYYFYRIHIESMIQRWQWLSFKVGAFVQVEAFAQLLDFAFLFLQKSKVHNQSYANQNLQVAAI